MSAPSQPHGTHKVYVLPIIARNDRCNRFVAQPGGVNLLQKKKPVQLPCADVLWIVRGHRQRDVSVKVSKASRPAFRQVAPQIVTNANLKLSTGQGRCNHFG
ncbi:hypothetical protein E2K80_04705 [Rhodophyticola sp. CCM32]|nr:hypothetical protein E2K80_04705 [Rhodophyticola sp. CCM32]